jgi:hypothetical protein
MVASRTREAKRGAPKREAPTLLYALVELNATSLPNTEGGGSLKVRSSSGTESAQRPFLNYPEMVVDLSLSPSLNSGHSICRANRSAEFLREAGKLGRKMALLFAPNLHLIDPLGERFNDSDWYEVPAVLELSLYGDFVEPLFARCLRHTGIHIGAFVRFARDRHLQIQAR